MAQVQSNLRRRILHAFVGRGLLESCKAKKMLGYQHSGFSVVAGLCIEAHGRAALMHNRAPISTAKFGGSNTANRAEF